ncbi:MAG TPA: hypothetical protein VLD67_13130 [Vicinamibacterales bacterium]|nr:hypothetical protein [Vicinamibacterales bacterium]
MRSPRVFLAAALLALLSLGGHAGAQVASNAPREAFTAYAVNISNVGATGATPLDIVIERWSTAAERERFMTVFRERGAEALLEALQSVPRVGYIRTPDSLAYDLRYAFQVPGKDGGRHIVLGTDRPIGFWEAAARPRTLEYPFTFIELRLDSQGRGEGKLSIATKLILSGDVLIIEDYANQPVMLNNVRKK